MFGQGVIPQDWTGDYCCYNVQWPNSPEWLAVLRGVLTMPAQGRFWDRNTGVIKEAQLVILETFDTNLHLQEVIMACNDPALAQIASALMLMAQNQAAILAQGCGGCNERTGSGGAGTSQPPPSDIVPGNPETDPPPEGFETWADYFNYKCAVAHYIVDTLESDLGNMVLLNIAGITPEVLAAAIAIAIATPIPYDDILAVAALIITIADIIVVSTALDLVNTNEEYLICELYNSTNASDAVNDFLTLFNELADDASIDPVETFVIKALMDYMIDVSVTNKLYTKDTTRLWSIEEGACDGCGSCVEIYLNTGTLEELTISSENIGLYNYISVNFRFDAGLNDYCPDTLAPSISFDLSGYTPSPNVIGETSLQIYDRLGNLIYVSNSSPTGEFCTGIINFYSDTPFTVSLTYGDDCEE